MTGTETDVDNPDFTQLRIMILAKHREVSEDSAWNIVAGAVVDGMEVSGIAS